jgi:hypothetical protein
MTGVFRRFTERRRHGVRGFHLRLSPFRVTGVGEPRRTERPYDASSSVERESGIRRDNRTESCTELYLEPMREPK